MSRNRVALLILIAVFPGLAACGEPDAHRAELDLGPVPIQRHEGAVCGMIVSDQSAPRAQVVHRDGTRAFLCSIGDLLVYLEAPSPHGAPAAILVEVMDPSEAPAETHAGPHPWIPASDGVYVVGIPRHGIMGDPVLVYRDRADAAVAMEGTAGRMLRFEDLAPWWRERHRGGGAPHGARGEPH